MTSESQVNAFLIVCVELLGVGFNPDTDFNDYVELLTRDKIFSEDMAKFMNGKMAKAFEYCKANGLDIYKIAFNQF